ncbi:MAG: hypothetical protein H6643_16265 [Caldilineaceae bacterium]|nr:hypothetical protein [Caldilineaceae bacterium]
MRLDPLATTFPTVEDGVLGVRFVGAAVRSNQQGGRWVDEPVMEYQIVWLDQMERGWRRWADFSLIRSAAINTKSRRYKGRHKKAMIDLRALCVPMSSW